MKSKILTVISAVAVLVASAVASSACAVFLYQPREPKALKK